MIAAAERETENVKYLLEQGADTAIQDENGHTLLWHCQHQKEKEDDEFDGFDEIINLLQKTVGKADQAGETIPSGIVEQIDIAVDHNEDV